jgi:hypothetical protein
MVACRGAFGHNADCRSVVEFTATRQDTDRTGGGRQCSGKGRSISSLFPAHAAAELPVLGESVTLTRLPPSHRLPFPALN